MSETSVAEKQEERSERRSLIITSLSQSPHPGKDEEPARTPRSLKVRMAEAAKNKFLSDERQKRHSRNPSRLSFKSHYWRPGRFNRLTVMDRIPLTDITRLHCIGVGCFGSVYLVKRKSDGKLFALKRLSKGLLMKDDIVRQLFQEKNCMLALDSPFFVRLFSTTKTQQFLILIMDLVDGGEFFTHLLMNMRFPVKKAIFYAANIILAFEHMHERGIIYRDLKPENLMFDATGYLKIIDFGFSKQIKDGETDTFCGTPEYMAPEVLRLEKHGYPYDWWTLGVLIYEMIGGISPFKQSTQEKIFDCIKEVRYKFLPWFPELTKDLIRGILKSDPKERIGVQSNIRSHLVFKDTKWNEIERQVQVPPYVPSKQAPVMSTAPVPFVEYKPTPESEALFAGF